MKEFIDSLILNLGIVAMAMFTLAIIIQVIHSEWLEAIRGIVQ